MNFYMDVVVPTKTLIPNNKPWITNVAKDLLKKKKRAFKDRDQPELKRFQRKLKDRFREGKESYRRWV